MSRDSLGISWVHGRFKLSPARRATVGMDLSVFWWSSRNSNLLRQAAERVLGTRVFLVVEHRELLFHVGQETPPVKARFATRSCNGCSQSRFLRASCRVRRGARAGGQTALLLRFCPTAVAASDRGVCGQAVCIGQRWFRWRRCSAGHLRQLPLSRM